MPNPLKQYINEIVENGIIEAIGDALSIHDTNFKILYQNEKAKKIIGNHTGKFCYKAFEQKDSICEDCPLALTFTDGKVRTVERRNPSRKELIVEITTSAIRDSHGDIIAGIEVVRDITRRKRWEDEREKLILGLQESLSKVKTLKGLLPICSSCNKIRDENDNWTNIDVYIRDHSQAELTHGYCPQCVAKYFSTDDRSVY